MTVMLSSLCTGCASSGRLCVEDSDRGSGRNRRAMIEALKNKLISMITAPCAVGAN